jgi:flagellar basal-body rod protein FlgF
VSGFWRLEVLEKRQDSVMDRIGQVALNTMRLLSDNQKITSANLANINTIGFRKDIATNVSSTFLLDNNSLEDRVFASRKDSGVDTTTSNLINTDRPLDIAVDGNGFIVGKTPSGEQIITRRGDIKIGVDGKMRNGDGTTIQGGGADITIPPYEKIAIANDGTISYMPLGAEGNTMVPAGRIDLVSVPSNNITRGLDGNLRVKSGPFPATDSNVKLSSNTLETSNVSSVDSMVEIIQNQRSYEMQIKLIGTAKELDTETSKLMRSS